MPDPIGKISLSRHAEHALSAHPELAAELVSPAPFTRAEMAAALQGAQQDDAATLKRRLRRLRLRVLLRVMARLQNPSA